MCGDWWIQRSRTSKPMRAISKATKDLRKKAALDRESADFFRSSAARDRKERRAFQKATMAALKRE